MCTPGPVRAYNGRHLGALFVGEFAAAAEDRRVMCLVPLVKHAVPADGRRRDDVNVDLKVSGATFLLQRT